MPYRLSALAERDLEEIWSYVAQDASPTTADRLITTASYGNLPGLNGRLEMDHWVAAGVPLRKLFQGLTIDNARAFRLDRDLGTVQVGKRANLLLLRENPLVSIDAYDTIETVIHFGRPLDRKGLSARSRP